MTWLDRQLLRRFRLMGLGCIRLHSGGTVGQMTVSLTLLGRIVYTVPLKLSLWLFHFAAWVGSFSRAVKIDVAINIEQRYPRQIP